MQWSHNLSFYLCSCRISIFSQSATAILLKCKLDHVLPLLKIFPWVPISLKSRSQNRYKGLLSAMHLSLSPITSLTSSFTFLPLFLLQSHWPSQDWNKCVGIAELLPRGSGEESILKFISVVGRIHFLVIIGLGSPFPCRRSTRGHSSVSRLPTYVLVIYSFLFLCKGSFTLIMLLGSHMALCSLKPAMAQQILLVLRTSGILFCLLLAGEKCS